MMYRMLSLLPPPVNDSGLEEVMTGFDEGPEEVLEVVRSAPGDLSSNGGVEAGPPVVVIE